VRCIDISNFPKFVDRTSVAISALGQYSAIFTVPTLENASAKCRYKLVNPTRWENLPLNRHACAVGSMQPGQDRTHIINRVLRSKFRSHATLKKFTCQTKKLQAFSQSSCSTPSLRILTAKDGVWSAQAPDHANTWSFDSLVPVLHSSVPFRSPPQVTGLPADAPARSDQMNGLRRNQRCVSRQQKHRLTGQPYSSWSCHAEPRTRDRILFTGRDWVICSMTPKAADSDMNASSVACLQ
jgi:hypothetical protein